jgi:hypothetical protein
MRLSRSAASRVVTTAALVLVVGGGSGGCASGAAVKVERRADGIVRLSCRTTLQACLDEAENVCNRERYVVLRAFDDHNYMGSTEKPTDKRTSEAFVRCGAGRAAWGNENKDLLRQEVCPAPAPAPVVPAPAPARACVPGATQPCTGPAGCQGGQACALDGTAFGACDCGPPPAPSPISPP